MHRGAVPTSLVLSLGLVLGACGGDEGERLSRDELIARANAVCEEGREELDAAEETLFGDLEAGEEPDADLTRTYLQEHFLPNVETQLRDLDDLRPPEDLADGYDDFLGSLRRGLDEVRGIAEDDPQALYALEENPFAETTRHADELGITSCGSGR
jgi:hypothetical protein